jgi:hypothetical protein
MFVAFVLQKLEYCLAISLPNITDQLNNENFEKTRLVPARLHFLHEFFSPEFGFEFRGAVEPAWYLEPRGRSPLARTGSWR